MEWALLSLRTGSPRPFGPRGQPSAIHKLPVSEAVYLDRTGFASDQQGDPRHHGGPEKAVHHYPAEHYAVWQHDLAGLRRVRNLRIGGFGENISTLGLTEANVSIGDVFRLGEALIQVSQPRQPCWKLNVRFNVKDMALRVQNSGRPGWYCRVLEPGLVSPAEALRRIERPSPQWTLRRVLSVLYRDCLNRDELAELAALPGLTMKMRDLLSRRLSQWSVEDWSARLDGDM